MDFSLDLSMDLRFLVLVALALFSVDVSSQPTSVTPVAALEEMRYCGAPARNADGSIRRRADVLTAFRRNHPCPITGLSTGACTGWSIDHVLPLACGGCDAVSNLQWLPVQIKSCPGTACKDRWERKIYCAPMVVIEPIK